MPSHQPQLGNERQSETAFESTPAAEDGGDTVQEKPLALSQEVWNDIESEGKRLDLLSCKQPHQFPKAACNQALMLANAKGSQD